MAVKGGEAVSRGAVLGGLTLFTDLKSTMVLSQIPEQVTADMFDSSETDGEGPGKSQTICYLRC